VVGVAAYRGRSRALRLDASLAVAGLTLEGTEPPGTVRLAAVTERVHQRRRQKVTAAVAACAVVLALLLGYALSPHRRTAPQPATTPSPETVNGFPRYQAGTEVTTTTTLTAADGRIGLGWSPPKADVTFFVRCSASTTGVVVFIAFTVGDKRSGSRCRTGCTRTLRRRASCRRRRHASRMAQRVAGVARTCLIA
jgi:hypothetical protein